MPVRYTLVGPNAGKTIHLGSAAPAGYDFVDGVYIFLGSENDSKLLDRVLTSYYSAYPDSMLAGAQAAYQAALAQPIPAAAVVSEADDKKAADDAAAKKAADEEAAKKAADEEAAKKAADEEAAKKAADEEAAKKAAAEKPDLATWLKALDPDVKDNWTESTGAVSMKAVEAVFGKDTSRADVEKALPGWNLAKAKATKAAADPLA